VRRDRRINRKRRMTKIPHPSVMQEEILTEELR
jgi:hypothetical protein